jgi:hypothetical protein
MSVIIHYPWHVGVRQDRKDRGPASFAFALRLWRLEPHGTAIGVKLDTVGCRGPVANDPRGLGRRRDAGASVVHGRANSPAEGSGVTIRIRYRILNARLAAGAVSGGGVDQAYDGWRVVSQFEFQQWVGSGNSLK